MIMRTFWVCGLLLCAGSFAGAVDEKPVLYVGESPASVYQKVLDAKRNVDTDTVIACTSRRVQIDQGRAYTALMQERSRLPQSLEVLDQSIVKNTATLELVGRRRDRETRKILVSRGTILMVKEDGTWRIRHEKWTDVGEEPGPDVRRLGDR